VFIARRTMVVLFIWIKSAMIMHPMDGLLNLDRSSTHVNNRDAKRCKVDNDSPTYLWHCRLGHIGVKRMKKLHADGLFGIS
jgi:hypothetical protein